nr:unnamed protein product [Callosobruchus analis]
MNCSGVKISFLACSALSAHVYCHFHFGNVQLQKNDVRFLSGTFLWQTGTS